MIVTCYYDIYNNHNYIENFFDSFSKLASTELPIILFTDNNLISRFYNMPKSVKIIRLPLDFFELYTIANNYSRELPNIRNPKKDTKEYLALLNTKIEFILRTSEICEDDTFIWCDFGLLNHIKDIDSFVDNLKNINNKEFNKVIIPGFFNFGCTFSTDEINCRFCGNFFVMPRKHIQPFYKHSKNVLSDFCTMFQYKLCWETNIWSIIETFAMRNEIEWYYADKDDTIIRNLNFAINQ
jgi:hypothetical protein